MTKAKSEVKERLREKLTPPSNWEIVFFNDPKTPQSFVKNVLIAFFDLTSNDASLFIAKVEKNNEASIGEFSRSIAETKCEQIIKLASSHGYPLVLEARKIER